MRHARLALIAASLVTASVPGPAQADSPATHRTGAAGSPDVTERVTPRNVTSGEVQALREDTYSPVTTLLVLGDGTELIVPDTLLAAVGPLAPRDRVRAVYERRGGSNVVTWLGIDAPPQVR
jgi:hypothetical protein